MWLCPRPGGPPRSCTTLNHHRTRHHNLCRDLGFRYTLFITHFFSPLVCHNCFIQSPCSVKDMGERCSRYSLPYLCPLPAFTDDAGMPAIEREGPTSTAVLFTSHLWWHSYLVKGHFQLAFSYLHALHYQWFSAC